jgi:hypothetical protein
MYYAKINSMHKWLQTQYHLIPGAIIKWFHANEMAPAVISVMML